MTAAKALEKLAGIVERDDLTGDASDEIQKEETLYENAKAVFQDLMLWRKEKIWNSVFLAAATGNTKRDAADMLPFERQLFQDLLKALDDANKSVREIMDAKPEKEHRRSYRARGGERGI